MQISCITSREHRRPRRAGLAEDSTAPPRSRAPARPSPPSLFFFSSPRRPWPGHWPRAAAATRRRSRCQRCPCSASHLRFRRVRSLFGHESLDFAELGILDVVFVCCCISNFWLFAAHWCWMIYPWLFEWCFEWFANVLGFFFLCFVAWIPTWFPPFVCFLVFQRVFFVFQRLCVPFGLGFGLRPRNVKKYMRFWCIMISSGVQKHFDFVHHDLAKWTKTNDFGHRKVQECTKTYDFAHHEIAKGTKTHDFCHHNPKVNGRWRAEIIYIRENIFFWKTKMSQKTDLIPPICTIRSEDSEKGTRNP